MNSFFNKGDARQLNMTRVAIISDKLVVQQPWFRRAVETLKNTSGIQDVVIFDEMYLINNHATMFQNLKNTNIIYFKILKLK